MFKKVKLILELRKDMKNPLNYVKRFDAIVIEAQHYVPIENFIEKILPLKAIRLLKDYDVKYFYNKIEDNPYLLFFKNEKTAYGCERSLFYEKKKMEEFKRQCYVANKKIEDLI